MYSALDLQKVQFLNEKFIKLQANTNDKEKGIITELNGTEKIYPADWVFDCTGGGAHVAQAVNSITGEDVFKASPLVSSNPIPNHLFAQVIISNPQGLITFTGEKINAVPDELQYKTAQEQIEIKERLAKLGWPYEVLPTFYGFPEGKDYPSKKQFPGIWSGKSKICLYMETPPDLSEEQQPAWIKELLNIYSYGMVTDYEKLNISLKYGNKPRIMTFKSNPHILNKAISQVDHLPVVIVGFDALKGFDYRLANGFSYGMTCCEIMLDGMTFHNGNIKEIDADSIEKSIFEYINGSYKTKITSLLNARQQSVNLGSEYFSNIYAIASEELSSLTSTEKQEYETMAWLYAYQAIRMHFSISHLPEDPLEALEVLDRYLVLLLRAQKYIPSGNSTASEDIKSRLSGVSSSIQLKMKQLNIQEVLKNGEIPKLKLEQLIQRLLKSLEEINSPTQDMQLILDKVRGYQMDLGSYLSLVSNGASSNSFFGGFFSSLVLSINDRRGAQSNLMSEDEESDDSDLDDSYSLE